MRNSDTILQGAKVRTLLPSSSFTYTDQELLNLATDEVISYIAPKIQQVRQSYFTSTIDVPLVTGVDRYRIPYRSIGGSIKEVKEKQSSTGDKINLPLYSLGEINGKNLNISRGVYVDGAHLVLVGSTNVSSYDTLEIVIYMRPNQLVPVSEAAQIIGVDDNTVSVNAVPTTFNTSKKVDFIKSNGLNDIYTFDQQVSTLDTSNSSITFSSLSDDIEVGDYISLATTSPVANIPEDFYPLLEQRLAVKILEGLGDIQKVQQAQQKAQELETYLMATIVPRIAEEEPVIVQNLFDSWDYY